MSYRESEEDPSPLDILLRYNLSMQEQRAVLSIIRHWALHDPHSFPAQLAVITLSQWHAAASVPVEVERLLGRYQSLLIDSSEEVDQRVARQLEQLSAIQEKFEQSAAKMQERAMRLYQLAEEAEHRLGRQISSFEMIMLRAHEKLTEETKERINRAEKRVVLLGSLLGVVLLINFCIWAAHWSSSGQTQVNETQPAVQTQP